MLAKILALTFLIAAAASGQTPSTTARGAQPKAPDNIGRAEAQVVWDSILTHCGGSYYESAAPNSVREYQHPSFRELPYKLSEADIANGYSWAGDAILTTTLWRDLVFRGGQWVEGAWQGGAKESFHPVVHSEAQEDVSIENVARVVAMWRKSGVWRYEFHGPEALYRLEMDNSGELRGWGDANQGYHFVLGQSAAAKLSCDAGHIVLSGAIPIPRVQGGMTAAASLFHAAIPGMPTENAGLSHAASPGAPTENRPSPPSAPSVNSAAPPGQTPAAPAYHTLDPASFKGLPPEVVLDLNLFRLQPSLLEDAQVLDYFIRLNNRDNSQIERRMSNEFDYPQIAAFYKARASEILKALPPSTLTFRVRTSLKDYDPARKAFPLNNQVRLDHFDVVSGGRANAVKGYEVTFRGISLNELPMDETAARSYVESLPPQPTPQARLAVRGVDFHFDVEILDQPPKALPFGKFSLAGRLTKVTAFKVNGTTALADLPVDGTSVPQSNAPPNSISAHPDKAGRVFQQDVASCNAGNAKACQMAGFSYVLGNGVDKDINMARQYFQKACDMGDKVSCASIKTLK